MQITVKSSKEIWKSPDGQRTINVLDTDKGEFRTFSDAIAEGFGKTFEVDVYEKDGKFGKERYVKQVQKDGTIGAAYGTRTSDAPHRNEASRSKAFALSYAKDIVVTLIANVPDYAKSADIVETTLSIARVLESYLDADVSKPAS